MSTKPPPAPGRPRPHAPALHNGDHLTRDEFERRYAATPDVHKAELIEGVVYMPSPVPDDHAGPHFDLIGWLGFYRTFTPVVVGGDNGTLRLDLGNEPQPDAFLRLLEAYGGQARVDEDGYVTGAPELVGEVAVSQASIDLNAKFEAYRHNGVREYVVWRVLDRAIDWFVLRGGNFVRLPLNAAGRYESEALPGLWLDPAALVRRDMPAVFQVVQQGVASAAHAAFVRRLAGGAP